MGAKVRGAMAAGERRANGPATAAGGMRAGGMMGRGGREDHRSPWRRGDRVGSRGSVSEGSRLTMGLRSPRPDGWLWIAA